MSLNEAATRPFWWDAINAEVTRPAVAADLDVDVAIIGAGYTGLWTAYYLKTHAPELQVAVIERRHVGFGASGRNGGWCHAEYPLGLGVLMKDHGADAARRHMRALFETVDEVGRVAAAEHIDCHFAKGGVLTLARGPAQPAAISEEFEVIEAAGLDGDGFRRLTAQEARNMLAATDVTGGMWHPHGAAIQPALLVHGLAEACERRGVTIYEDSAVTEVGTRRLLAAGNVVKAEMVVRATEGYTSDLPGLRRDMAPLYSLMIATEPLAEATWDELGLTDRATFGDCRNLIIYGQRTADGRFAFGGRGAPYYFGSNTRDGNEIHDGVHQELARVLVELFPVLGDTKITHRWGGALGASRDWRPSVSIDRKAGLAWAGGYVGDGVATSALAGRTLTDLILERGTDITTLPWVGHRWRKWEPEPLRWIGINAGLRMAKAADAAEERTGRPSRWAEVGNWLRGKTR